MSDVFRGTRCGSGRPPINLNLSGLGTDLPFDPDSCACKGHHRLFDPRNDGEPLEAAEKRQAAAEAICATCPVLKAGGAWVDGLPPKERPSGVVAGRYYSAAGERQRQRKEAS